MTPSKAAIEAAEIEHTPSGRIYIPFGAGWEVQTKGNGSTFRISDGKQQWPVTDPYLHDVLTRMAYEVRAVIDAHGLKCAKAMQEAAADIVVHMNFERKVKTHYATDKSPHKGDKCPHERYTWEPCEECVSEAFEALDPAKVVEGGK